MTYPRTTPARTVLVLMLALLAAFAVMVAPLRSSAEPGDDEGGTASLRVALEKANRGWTEANTRLQNSKKKQATLQAGIRATEQRIAVLTEDLDTYGSEAYRGGGLATASALLDSNSVPNFVDKMSILQQLSKQHGDLLRRLRAEQATLAAQKSKVETEIGVQQAQEKVLAKRKADAEKALAVVGGVPSDGYTGQSAVARPAPRGANGEWPRESCSIDDPTSGGCLTPRMNHARLEARAAGFTHYHACFRQASFGEHGKGRACDFAANATGFAGTASGADRDYGNRLAAYFVSNSSRLAVLYVIWFRQIWMPSTGWRSYSGGGSPSADHTNHVHLSVQ